MIFSPTNKYHFIERKCQYDHCDIDSVILKANNKLISMSDLAKMSLIKWSLDMKRSDPPTWNGSENSLHEIGLRLFL